MLTTCLFIPRIGPAVALSLSAVLLSAGCVSSKYKSAGKDLRSPVALNLTAAPAPHDAGQSPAIEVLVHSLIAFHGPGSWKRDAYWDEYALTIRNCSPTTLTVDSAALTDFQTLATSPGTDPWELEKQSHGYEASVLAAFGPILEIGNGADAVPAGALAVGATVVSVNDKPRDGIIDLARLAGLHLKSSPAAKPVTEKRP